jgi:hypothetical protein
MTIEPAAFLSEKAKALLVRLCEFQSTEAQAVAETLNDIAGNGEEDATDEHMITCALEIVVSAKWFIAEMESN